MDYERVYDWSAKRAGACITVYGKTRENTFRRIAGITQIAVEGDRVIATDQNGDRYALVVLV